MHIICHVFANWHTCSPHVRETCIESLLGQLACSARTNKYQVECAGSGVRLGTLTYVSKWLKTHRLFLGHGGSEIVCQNDIPKTFDGVVVASKRVFQGILLKQSDHHEQVWHPTDPNVFATRTKNSVHFQTTNSPPQLVWHHPLNGDLGKSLIWRPYYNSMWFASFYGHIYYASYATQDSGHFSLHDAPILTLEWSPNGLILVTGDTQGYVKLHQPSGTLVHTLHPTHFEIRHLKWNCDGSILAIVYSRGLTFAHVGQDRQVRSTSLEMQVRNVFWNPVQCNVLAILSINGLQFNIEHKKQCVISGVECMAWHPNGKMLAAAMCKIPTQNSIQFFDIKGQVVHTIHQLSGPIISLAWNSNGSMLAAACSQSIQFWSLGGVLLKTLEVSTTLDTRRTLIEWNADGKKLSVVDEANGFSQIWH